MGSRYLFLGQDKISVVDFFVYPGGSSMLYVQVCMCDDLMASSIQYDVREL